MRKSARKVKLDDFYFMRQGLHIRPLLESESSIIEPFEIFRDPVQGCKRDKALLLLHGFGSTPAVWRVFKEDPRLLEKYDAVIAPVLPGHSESIQAFGKVTAQQWLNEARYQLQRLLSSYNKVDVAGLSLGGLIACHLSYEFSINHLYLLAPALCLKSVNIPLAKLGLKFLRCIGVQEIKNLGGNLNNNAYEELLYKKLPLHSIEQILSFISQFHWKAPVCSTDLFLGQKDAVVNSNKIYKKFSKVPHVHMHMLTNSAHVLPLDHDREYIMEQIYI